MFRLSSTLLLLAASASVLSAAEIDTVYRKSDGKAVGGEITAVSKTEVVVTQKVGNKEEHIPANDIRSVEWKGEPIGLGLARSNQRSGNLSEALEGYPAGAQRICRCQQEPAWFHRVSDCRGFSAGG
ncbi:MAG: hypothetical protein KDA90_00250 [Planctomycetaceae bacterium]|nr:hypothetical protein [Planctomycetaceae bacterium]